MYATYISLPVAILGGRQLYVDLYFVQKFSCGRNDAVVEAVHAGSSCSRKVHETTFEGLLPLRGIPTYTLRVHVILTHVLQPLALH